MDFSDSMPVDDGARILQLLEISRSSHVLVLVSRLEIKLHYLCDLFLAAITQFTRLNEIRIAGRLEASLETSMPAVRALLALGTVQRVALHCTFSSSAVFLQIWNGCSGNIRHLELGVRVDDFGYDWGSASGFDRHPKIKLASLRLLRGSGEFVLPWLETDACPFSVSQLISLTMCMSRGGLLHWPEFQPKTIERLELGLSVFQNPVDLAPFTRLCYLVLHIYSTLDFEMALNTFATIPPANCISSVSIFCSSVQLELFARLDNLLSGMPLPELAQVMVFAYPPNVEAVKRSIPKLHPRKLLSVEPLSDAVYFRQAAIMIMRMS